MKKIIISISIVVFLAALGFYFFNKKPKISYEELMVERSDITISILSTGTVQPENRLEIKPPIAGRVEDVLVKEGDRVEKGQILAWMSSTERAALLDAARSEGRNEVKKWEQLYRPTPVIAPIPGTIILKSVEAGQSFNNTDPILVMSDRLSVKAQVDETDLAKIKLNQDAWVVLDAYSQDKISAKVNRIAYEATTVNNVTTYLIDVMPSETPEYMRSGMTANITFLIESKKAVLTIPVRALNSENSEVLVLDKSGKMVSKKITTGLSDGRVIEVLEGLDENQKIFALQIDLQSTSGGTNPFSPTRKRGGGR